MMILLLRYWREAVIGILLIVLMAACHSRDNALVERGKAEVRAHTADSLLSTNAIAIAPVVDRLVHDTVRVTDLLRRIRIDTVQRRDTVYASADTGHVLPLIPLPAAQVAVYDSLVPACRSLSNDCAVFKKLAQERFDDYDAKLKAVSSMPPSSCLKSNVAWGIIGAGTSAAFLRR
jgi:hypothetical protein